MDRLTAEQIRQNSITGDAWASSAAHRTVLTSQVIRERPPGAARLCVLGAGNSNDLDLQRLATEFQEIHLVDLDATALLLGVDRQGLLSLQAPQADAPLEVRGGVHGPHLRERFVARQARSEIAAIACHGFVDLSGIIKRINHWTPDRAPASAEIDACIRSACERTAPVPPGSFDFVVSTCVLGPMIESVVRSLARQHPRFAEVVTAIRDRHLRMLLELLAPGGCGVLISEIVTSDALPELDTASDEAIPRLVDQFDANEQLGENRAIPPQIGPLAVADWFKTDAAAIECATDVELLRPWRWRVGPKTLAVYMLQFRKRASSLDF